jgi:hypothetical protein
VSTGRRVAIGVGAAVVVIAAVLAFLFWPRGTTEITEEDAVETFRDKASTTITADDADAGRSTPEPGVYTFQAEGEETVKLGPLPAQTRPFPATVTAVAVDAGDGCFDWTINLFAEHTEETRWCTHPLTLDRHVKHQTIGALSPTATMTCDLEQVEAVGSTEPLDLSCTLEMSGGPIAVSATLKGTATTGEAETVDVGGTDVEATPITVRFEVSGGLGGTWEETTWWSESHLPVRIERSLDLSGPATFSETSSLRLTDLTPTS